MAFTNAKDFVIQAEQISMVDNSSSGAKDEVAFQHLFERACHGASHKAEERFDPPKCHKDTRVAVINDIMSWANDKKSDQRILWMSGAAGAGKSAISQTVAERCDGDMLVASFFFSRTANATGRSDGNRLIASLAFQMTVSVPETKPFVLKALQDNPAVLKHSMDTQMQKLIVEPLSAGITAEARASHKVPELIIIDGLDECYDPKIQVSIIQTIALDICELGVPLRFLIASRPELEIRKTFGIQVPDKFFHKLVLDEKYNPEKDIELYIRSEFSIIKRNHASLALVNAGTTWPSDSDISTLVQKSSGQFIYASTVMKYINNDRKNPKELLEVIINITPSPDNPYVQLDALYDYILSNYQHDYSDVKCLFEALHLPELRSIDSHFLRLRSLSDYGDFICVKNIELVASDLHSILDVGTNGPRFYHASFSDFLNDIKRSGSFFVDTRNKNVTGERLCRKRIDEGHDKTTTASVPLLVACSNYFIFLRECPAAVAGFQKNPSSQKIVDTAIRHLV